MKKKRNDKPAVAGAFFVSGLQLKFGRIAKPQQNSISLQADSEQSEDLITSICFLQNVATQPKAQAQKTRKAHENGSK